MRRQVVVIGEARIDEIRDRRGLRELPAGVGLEAARLLSRRGLETVLFAAVGEDRDGGRIRCSLGDAGVRLVAFDALEGTTRRRVVDGSRGLTVEWSGTRSLLSLPEGLVEAPVVVRAQAEGVPLGPGVTVDVGEEGVCAVIGRACDEGEQRFVVDVLDALCRLPAASGPSLHESLSRIAT